ncbi:site-specific integrase, partial [Methanospirillum stamsii]
SRSAHPDTMFGSLPNIYLVHSPIFSPMPLQTIYTDNDRFHNFKKDYPIRTLNNALERGELSPDDVTLIRAYLAERTVVSRISSKRLLKLISSLVTIRRFLTTDFRNADVLTIYTAVNSIKTGETLKGEQYSQNTKADLVQILKSFFLWMIDSELTNLPEKKIRAIKTPTKISTKTDADLISPEEITALIEACCSDRDRAMFMTLYEGGFRCGEIGEMRWSHLAFDGTGIVATVRFKTEKTRHVRLVMSKEYLTKWRSVYPGDPSGDSLVFLNERGKPMTHAAISRQLDRLQKRAGIERHFTLHLFRHSRITHLLQQGVSESVIKMMMWGTIETKMFRDYAHLNGDDTDREIFKLYGIEHTTTQVTEGKIEPKICPHCHEINSPVSKYCHICSHPLDKKELASTADFQAWMLENVDLLTEFLQEQKSRMEKATSASINM